MLLGCIAVSRFGSLPYFTVHALLQKRRGFEAVTSVTPRAKSSVA